MAFSQKVTWQGAKPQVLRKLKSPSTLVVIPAFNEEDCIKHVLGDLLDHELDFHVLVINDGSEDRTERFAREEMTADNRLFVLNIPNNIGIGGAVQAGFKFACRNGYSLVVQVDGDGQHRADQLEKVITPIKEKKADIVIGSRFLEKTGFNSSLVRRLGIRFFAGLIYALTGKQVTDPTSGFRAFNRRAIEYLADNYAEDYPEPESVIILHRRLFKLLEVPVVMNNRAGGKSSISPLKSSYYMTKVTVAILMDLFRRRGHINGRGSEKED